MAAEAVLRDLVLHVAGAVAIGAGDVVVDALEREAGLLLVIELRVLPAAGAVAIGAFRTAIPAVHIVRLVTGHAFLRRVLVAIAEVAGDARHVDVLVAQREVSLVVIVADVPPLAGVMTGVALAAQLALVRLLFLMAGDAFLGRFAKALAHEVATLADDGRVSAAQGELSALVIELLTAQFHDIARAAQ